MLLNINGMEMLGVGNKIKEKGLTLIEALVSTVIAVSYTHLRAHET